MRHIKLASLLNPQFYQLSRVKAFFFLFSIMAFSIMAFNLFSKRLGGVAGTSQTSEMEPFVKLTIYAVHYLCRELRLECLITSSDNNLFKNMQEIINRLPKLIVI